MASNHKYFTKRFRDSREVFDWLNQFTDQFSRMGLIGDRTSEKLSFKKEILSIIKNEAAPEWNVDQIHDKNKGYANQGYGIMACRSTCNQEVQDYWDQQSPSMANSWGMENLSVNDYANIQDGTVSDPKEAMYRGAMYYAVLRRKAREQLGTGAKSADVIKSAFKTYNGRGSRAEDYSNKAIATYSDMKKENGEWWDEGNFAKGATGVIPAVASDIASTWRSQASPMVDRNVGVASNSALARGVSDLVKGNVPGGRWDFIKKSFTDPIKQGMQSVLPTYNKGKDVANKLLKKEALEESTEQEILAKFAKEVLGLDVSDEQMQQVIQQLDITDVVGIKRAIDSGDFEGLRLGESRLKEYHSSPGAAANAKLKRQGQAPNVQASGPPLAPREPKKIAGNNANPERPPTGASNSTRRSVPSMPKSQVARNLIVMDPDTGEQVEVTNDIGATQMLRRAKRIG
jgi:hypothetical protein